MKELEIIARLRDLCSVGEGVEIGIGDDAAVLSRPEGRTLVCKDMLLDGVHFKSAEVDPFWIGHKALAVNLSDIAAMGGRASSAYVGLALPRRLSDSAFLDRLYEGMGALAKRFQLTIAGGDTNIWNGPLVVSVTVIGSCHERGPVTRKGAAAGDFIFVTGPLGDSYASEHHLRFVPRLEEVKALLKRVPISSMIDVSDGLGKDLRLLASMSDLRACLYRERIPLRATLSALDRGLALERALNDGEDFELCFSLKPEDAAIVLHEAGLASFCHHIGYMAVGEGLVWDEGVRGFKVIEARGYEHQ